MECFGLALAVATWSVDILRKRAEHLGEVDAPDEQAAIKRAARSARFILLALGALLVIVTLVIVAPTVIFWH